MKAMIFAAGLGTRLRPLTNDRPKALVTVAGRTLLEIALSRLRAFGVRQVMVNTHHYAETIADYLKANGDFGMSIELSREEELLDTGGGLKKAAHFFLDSGDNSPEPFIVHNVDVISTIDLGRMMQFHIENGALATLAVQDRATSRPLLFDGQGHLCGRRFVHPAKAERVQDECVRPAVAAQPLAFSGVHIVSPQIFAKMTEEGAFSIIAAYLRLASQGEKIVAFRTDECYWRDLGRPQSILEAAQDIAGGKYSIA
ncbi:MAG: nucleotidyltransferase family protein [Terracidiphilus sp.]|jgi:NDP-sugar pyrophosphorylase family protein